MPQLEVALYEFQRFLEMGGPILLVIMANAFLLWTLILERYWYYATTHRGYVKQLVERWNQRADHKSWYAHQIRDGMITEAKLSMESMLGIIAVLVALCPLLGLLGTVTGMIQVFDVMAQTGSSNARLMAGGVSRATLPTMAGMTIAISGLYFSIQLQRKAKTETQKLADHLVLGV